MAKRGAPSFVKSRSCTVQERKKIMAAHHRAQRELEAFKFRARTTPRVNRAS